jgi:predicted RNA-binding protein (TIGR00451 family)
MEAPHSTYGTKHAFMCFVTEKRLIHYLISNKEKNRPAGNKNSKIMIRKTGARRSDIAAEKNQFDRSKVRMSLDYIFGPGTSRPIDFTKISFIHSRKTGRLKHLEDRISGRVLFTFRPNGTIAPTVAGASVLISDKRNKRARWIVKVIDGVSEIVASGKTVFCRHVTSCSDLLRAGEDVVILNERGELLAVGCSVLSGPAMKQFKRGQAVKVREGTKF